MEVLRISGGHRFRLRYGPSPSIHKLKNPATVAFSPRGLRGIKPKVLVKEGDSVHLRQPIVEDKTDPRIKFVSPAAGVVQEVRYGPRRVLEALVIAIDEDRENAVQPEKQYDFAQIDALGSDDVERMLLREGLWAYFECFPKMNIAPLPSLAKNDTSAKKISAIHINLLRTEAHWPDPMLVIDERIREFKAGITALSKLCQKIRIYILKGAQIGGDLKDMATVVEVVNKYPADSLGVQAFYAGALAKDEVVVGADAELVLDVGNFLLNGKKRTERLYCLAGNAAKDPRHFLGRIGAAIGDLTDSALKTTEDVRLIAGGLFNGYKVRFQDYLSPMDTSLQAMVEDKKRIPLVFFRLGKDRLTTSRTWLSGFKSDVEHEASTNNNGEERACIQCGYCIEVCPVKLMPNLILKASLTKDIEKMEWLCIDDCVDCGLCTFVCPSKIELGQQIESGKKLIEKEG